MNWTNNDVKMLFGRLISVAASKGVLVQNKELEEVREYIKNSPDILNQEMVEVMYQNAQGGNRMGLHNDLANRYHALTGAPMDESLAYAKEWVNNAREQLAALLSRRI